VKDLAMSVGNTGSVVALDSSDPQIEAARATCADLTNVEYVKCSASHLPFDDASFDSIVSIQTLEYIPEVDAVLKECARVLKPGRLFVSISVMWDHFRVHGADEALTDKMLGIFRGHCAHQNLPVDLPAKLEPLSFIGVQQVPIPIYLNTFHCNSFGNLASGAIREYAKNSGKMTDAEIEKWDASLAKAVAENRFAFCSFPVVTAAALNPQKLRLPPAIGAYASPPPSAPGHPSPSSALPRAREKAQGGGMGFLAWFMK